MIKLDIPGRGKLVIKNLILDLNGTIALDGAIIEGVSERLQSLSDQLDIFIVTADTRGRAEQTIEELTATPAGGEPFSIKLHKIEKEEESTQKLKLMQKLGVHETISIGNGSNDVYMLKESSIGICMVGREGAAVEAMTNADLVAFDINDALDLVLVPERLIATFRK